MAKKEKKKKKSILPTFIIIVLIIVILLMLWLKGGFGGGAGDNDGDGDTTSSISSVVDSVEDESSEAEKSVEKVTVSGSDYSYGGKTYTLDDLKAALESKENIVVEIQDDGAVANAVDDLHSALDDMGISYSDATAE